MWGNVGRGGQRRASAGEEERREIIKSEWGTRR